MSAACPHGDATGAWVLRALGEDEAIAFDAHLQTCEHCLAEVETLQGVADTLGLAAPVVVPPPALRQRILAIVERESELLRAAGPDADIAPAPRPTRGWRRSFSALRPLPTAAAASALLLAGAVGGVVLSSGPDAPRVRTVAAQVSATGAKAEVRLSEGRAELAVFEMPKPPRERVYQVWLKRNGEAAEPTHSLFHVRNDGRAVVRIDESVRGVDELLVTAEPDGGSDLPTRQPIVRAPLS